MTARKPKILLSEGSSLSSREAITALGLAGHRVELVSSDAVCLGRFSRFVTRVHQAPACGAEPPSADGGIRAFSRGLAAEDLMDASFTSCRKAGGSVLRSGRP